MFLLDIGGYIKRGADIICPPPLSGPIFSGVQSDIGCNNDSNLGWARPKSPAIWDQYIGGVVKYRRHLLWATLVHKGTVLWGVTAPNRRHILQVTMVCVGPIWVDPHPISEALLGGHLSIYRDNLHGNPTDIGYLCGRHS